MCAATVCAAARRALPAADGCDRYRRAQKHEAHAHPGSRDHAGALPLALEHPRYAAADDHGNHEDGSEKMKSPEI